MRIGAHGDKHCNEHEEMFVEFFPRLDGKTTPSPQNARPPSSTLFDCPWKAWSHFFCCLAEYARTTPGSWLYHRIGPELNTIRREEWQHPDLDDPAPWPLDGDVGYRVYCRFLISEKAPLDGAGV